MKSTAAFGLALLAVADAYPNVLAQLEAKGVKTYESRSIEQRVSIPPFDAASQYVDTTGDHAFVAPGPNDQRGPCPGLNAMANHGYMPHNGIGSITDFIVGTGEVFGMGVDLSTVLAVYGAVFDGDLTKWSIGGPDALVSTLGLLGVPQGISGSHNKYEGDASPTRGDLYVYGNDYDLQLSQFQALYDLGKAEDNYDLDLLTEYRHTRFHESISQNPYFFNAPFSGVIAQPAAWAFIYRFMANKSEEYPEGRLNGEVLKSFFAVTGEDGDFTYTPGYERIPDNWYTRNALDPYDVPFLSVDSNLMLLKYPEFGSVGGNLGQPNTFFGLDPGDLTSDVYSASSLTEGNNLLCFGMQLAIQETPDILSGLFTDIDAAQDKIGAAFNNATNSLGCPTLNNVDKAQFGQFPGYAKKYDGYNAPDPSLLGSIL